MAGVDDGSLQADSQSKLDGLVWGSVPALQWVWIHQMSWKNSLNSYGHDNSTINIDSGIIINIIVHFSHVYVHTPDYPGDPLPDSLKTIKHSLSACSSGSSSFIKRPHFTANVI